ncbi:hypothetical protein BGZ54_000955, partial [Gamsiella multidivaricata]
MSTLTEEQVNQNRARYTTLVAKNVMSENLLKMPNVATKPESDYEIEVEKQLNIACNMPRAEPAPMSNMKMVIEDEPLATFPSGYQVQ